MNYTTPNKAHYTVEQQKARLPLYLREFYETRQLDRIKIDGNEIQGYFEYSFIEEKSYLTSPERTASGVIDNMNAYPSFLTPRLVIKYNYMHIGDYRQLMTLLNSKNEFTVECYNIVKDKRVVHKMYHATPDMPTIHQRYLEVLGVKDYTVELIGTNADIQKASVIYHLNNPDPENFVPDKSLTYYDEPDVYAGEDIIIGGAATDIINETFGGEAVFNGWNISPDNPLEAKPQGNYTNNSVVIVPEGGLQLYAQWILQTDHKLLFNYGLADPVINNESLSYETFRNVTYGQSIGTLPTPADPKVKAKDLDGVEREYSPYYNGGWYKTPIKASNSIPIENGTTFWARHDTAIYRLYDVLNYKITFNIQNNTGNGFYNYSEYLMPYNSRIAFPNFVKFENGEEYSITDWYTNEAFTKRFEGNTMPPYNLTLYGKWDKR